MGGRVTRECEYCGKTFSAYRSAVEAGNARFCSKACFYKSQANRVIANCQTCGKEFETFPSALKRGGGKFCSVGCRAKAQDAHLERTCKLCSRSFLARRGEAEVGRARYCSDRCRSLAHRKRITFICAECGQETEVPQCRGDMKFCSYECLERWRQHEKRITRICLQCGKQFEEVLNRVENGKGKFCSHKCYLQYKGETSIERLIREELALHPEIRFEQEVRIGPYRVDFLLPERHVVIECDGRYWHSFAQVFLRDRRKNRFLAEKGYQVFRLSEAEIRKSPSSCVNHVLLSIAQIS